MAGWHLEVDPIACDGHGLCADLFPEGIRLDDWGYPQLAGGDIPEDLEARARQAMRMCPTVALRLKPTTAAGRDATDGPLATIGPGRTMQPEGAKFRRWVKR